MLLYLLTDGTEKDSEVNIFYLNRIIVVQYTIFPSLTLLL